MNECSLLQIQDNEFAYHNAEHIVSFRKEIIILTLIKLQFNASLLF